MCIHGEKLSGDHEHIIRLLPNYGKPLVQVDSFIFANSSVDKTKYDSEVNWHPTVILKLNLKEQVNMFEMLPSTVSNEGKAYKTTVVYVLPYFFKQGKT